MQAVIDNIKNFVNKEIRPRAKEIEESRTLPRKIIDQLAELNILGAPLPLEYGGLNMNHVDYGLMTNEIGKGCSNVRAVLTVHTSLVGETLAKLGSSFLKDQYLPELISGKKIAAFALTEPEVGSDAQSIQTSYKKNGGYYILNGIKKWITFGDIADIFLVVASNQGKSSTFIVERDFGGVESKPIKGLLAGKASHIAEVSFKDVKIPESNLLGREGAGFTFVVNTALFYGRYSIAWAGLSLAEAALEEMVSYSRKRSQFGKKLYSFQAISSIIAKAVSKVHAGRNLCLSAGIKIDNEDENAIMETNIAKYFTSKIAMEVTTDAVQVHGGNGCYSEYPVERLFREAKIMEIIEGSSQIQEAMISRYGLGRYFLRNN